MRIASVGHAVFAATLVAIGIVGFAHGDFAGIWQPIPKDWPAREMVSVLCAIVSLACGLGLVVATNGGGRCPDTAGLPFALAVAGENAQALSSTGRAGFLVGVGRNCRAGGGCVGAVLLVCFGLGQENLDVCDGRSGSTYREGVVRVARFWRPGWRC